jgi:adenylate cyclase
MTGPRLARRIQVLLTLVNLLSNVIGAVVVIALLAFVVPTPPGEGGFGRINMLIVPLYVGVATVTGAVAGTRHLLPRLRWIRDETVPTPAEQRLALRAPLRLLVVSGLLWAWAAALFSVVNGMRSTQFIAPVIFTVASGGITTCATTYLLNERVLRPVAALALSHHPPERQLVPGVTSRSLLAWVLGSAVPVGGLVSIAIYTLAGREVTVDRLAIAILGLGGITIAVGFLTTLLAARATTAAVQSVRAALQQVEAGDLTVRTPVFDGTQVGLLQAGFNRMAAGLEERERIRDLFGRHVGEGVAADAIAGDTALGGEVRDVGVVFVDVIGSTRLAATRPPAEVVGVLNRFFAVVVDVVHAHGGFVNKFEGDAALAIFGAPVALEQPADAALAAARDLAARLAAEVPDCDAGVGVSFGPAVAGNVGALSRYEYTVIGDPVNEGARLCELAKERPGRVAASGRAVAAAGPGEAARWSVGDGIVLRGRVEPTPIATVLVERPMGSPGP